MTPAPGPTRRTLADGRHIFYFDDAGATHTRTARDLRELPSATIESQMRYDVLTGQWITMASHRMTRTHLPTTAECPLCPTTLAGAPTEIPEANYDVAVFENRFPSFVPAQDELLSANRFGPDDRRAVGHCEVMCFSSDHTASVGELPAERLRTIVGAWISRTEELSADPSVEQVFCFENRGEEIGVTLSHPHGQIYAYPYVTPRTQAMLVQADKHFQSTGRSLLADVLAFERQDGARVVYSGKHWSAYVPAAARWPIEIHLAPHRDVPDLPSLNTEEREELAQVYQDLLQRIDSFYPGIDRAPYIAAWHQAPIRIDRHLGRLHLQLFSILRAPGKLKYLAGSESAMGAWISDTVPEAVATRLRELA
ncbi:galactose-1-phosphate uridylyltransferase [Rhodococcus sp. AD45-ID]|uniref:galactose-1-phosphate uridylyltransferase n=1 Tax=unclassified Rhodococcus (in: high G+C Gram-positive bacteria) TaxID=192944 RepID=UPI0005D327A5|nr:MULTISPECIES: galactose-1-phosphate uridylyltransferase [unclassified Rhodococcus (in: high G+C Gram-positive bacteria)]KJF24471.1 Galactose-1-phosphate uridylyltransferase [Rhodococcus sp. AD45]PSR42766.1 galactose-1-phosphate uridylyltransferase [Rhodococcus sp. AD45-ID]